jgi:probable rRNA maturation factor
MIEIDNKQIAIQITEEINKTIKNAIEEALKYENFLKPYEVSVLITDNTGIQEINSEFRHINKATDVLSFPMLNNEHGSYKNGEIETSFEDINPESGEILLGDIVISIEKAYSQAEEYGHSTLRELAFLTVHSVLHLLGYDHEFDEDRIIMRNKEEEILDTMKLSR